jgi:hypothetical protein
MVTPNRKALSDHEAVNERVRAAKSWGVLGIPIYFAIFSEREDAKIFTCEETVLVCEIEPNKGRELAFRSVVEDAAMLAPMSDRRRPLRVNRNVMVPAEDRRSGNIVDGGQIPEGSPHWIAPVSQEIEEQGRDPSRKIWGPVSAMGIAQAVPVSAQLPAAHRPMK